jgi:hypothetical protein
MTEAHISAQNDFEGHPWIVEFTDLRVRNETQRRVAESLDPHLLGGLLEIWLKVVTPGAKLVEQHGCATRRIIFGRRADLRKFTGTFGGRIASTTPPALTPSGRQG